MLKISVVLAAFNGEKYIKEQLDSIENQSLPPFELIIIDDDSSDATRDIIEEYIGSSKLNIRFFKNEQNLGFFENFKKGLSLAEGDVCALCDQDDIWQPDKLKKLEEIFADSFVYGCAAGFRFIDENGVCFENEMLKGKTFAFLDRAPKTELTKITLEQISHRNIAPGCACAYKKAVVDRFLASGVPDLPHDYQLSAIAAALDGFYFYNKPLTRYRIHGKNTLGLKPLDQTRLDVAREKEKLGEAVSGASAKGKEYYDLSKKRAEYLKNKKPFKIIKMFFLKPYRRYYTLKERLGDVVYAIGR
ncbi:MAG: glycosyltransferase [Clostridia bacterium]|nr:glycosyltransferase [Clostridia bacterium]